MKVLARISCSCGVMGDLGGGVPCRFEYSVMETEIIQLCSVALKARSATKSSMHESWGNLGHCRHFQLKPLNLRSHLKKLPIFHGAIVSKPSFLPIFDANQFRVINMV